MSPALYPMGLAVFVVTTGFGGLSLLAMLRRLDGEQRQRLLAGYPAIRDVAVPPLVGLIGLHVVLSQFDALTLAPRLAIALPATLGLALVMYRAIGRKLDTLGFEEEVQRAHGLTFALLVLGAGALMLSLGA